MKFKWALIIFSLMLFFYLLFRQIISIEFWPFQNFFELMVILLVHLLILVLSTLRWGNSIELVSNRKLKFLDLYQSYSESVLFKVFPLGSFAVEGKRIYDLKRVFGISNQQIIYSIVLDRVAILAGFGFLFLCFYGFWVGVTALILACVLLRRKTKVSLVLSAIGFAVLRVFIFAYLAHAYVGWDFIWSRLLNSLVITGLIDVFPISWLGIGTSHWLFNQIIEGVNGANLFQAYLVSKIIFYLVLVVQISYSKFRNRSRDGIEPGSL